MAKWLAFYNSMLILISEEYNHIDIEFPMGMKLVAFPKEGIAKLKIFGLVFDIDYKQAEKLYELLRVSRVGEVE